MKRILMALMVVIVGATVARADDFTRTLTLQTRFGVRGFKGQLQLNVEDPPPPTTWFMTNSFPYGEYGLPSSPPAGSGVLIYADDSSSLHWISESSFAAFVDGSSFSDDVKDVLKGDNSSISRDDLLDWMQDHPTASSSQVADYVDDWNEGQEDTDEDGEIDWDDTDDDNDGWSDAQEIAGGSDPKDPDSVPSEGEPDGGGSNPGEYPDTDGDGVPDWQDTDDDNDGWSDEQEIERGTNPKSEFSSPLSGEPDGGGDNPGTYLDSDDDGVPDWQDTDDDNDGYSDGQEASNGTDPLDSGSIPEGEEPDGGGANPGGGSGGGGTSGPPDMSGFGGESGLPEQDPENPIENPGSLFYPNYPEADDSTVNQLLQALQAMGGGWSGVIPAGAANPVIVIRMDIPGQGPTEYNIPLLPDVSTPLGASLDVVRVLLRSLLAATASFKFFAAFWTTLRQY